MMATTPAQIDLWLQEDSEHQRLEFKEAKNQYDNAKLYKNCVALANEGGGILLLGVTDKIPRRVVGSQAFRDPVEMAEKLFTAVGFRVDIEAVAHPKGRVLVFHIPSRPRGTAYHLDGAYLMRSGEELVPMSEDRLRAIFTEGQPDWLEESSKADLPADQVVALLDTQAFFSLMEKPYPTKQKAVLEQLVSERLIDKSPGGFAIRRMGAILLAQKLADFPDVSRKAARVVVYSTPSKSQTKLDQTWETGYASGFRNLVAFIMGQLPQNEVVEEAIRRKMKLLPEIVIREIVANAMIHQDFAMTGASPMIEVYPNRVEISNPGEPIVPVERFIDGYQSRNERLADLMRRMRICEEKSSGIDQVIEAAETFQLPAPEFLKEHRRTNVVIHGQQPFRDMDRDARVRACYQHCVLRYVIRKVMTNQSLRVRFGLAENQSATVSQVIKSTLEAELIRPDEVRGGSRKLARYVPFWA
jgi:predicted HTH transcriptional regulator